MLADSSAQRVFISYSRQNSASADKLAAFLEAAGFEILMDRRSLPYGEEWRLELTRLIASADAVAWLLSPHSVASQWCRWEIDEVQQRSKRLIPVLIEPVAIATLPDSIGQFQILPREGVFDIERDGASLSSALGSDYVWLREHTRIGERATQWVARNCSRDNLLRGLSLNEAEAWRDRRPAKAPALSEEMSRFLFASRQADIRSNRIWLSSVAGVAFAGLVLSGGMFWQWRLASQQRDIAQNNAYAAASGFLSTAEALTTELQRLAGTNPDAVLRIMEVLATEQKRVLSFIGDDTAIDQASARLRANVGDALAAAGRRDEAYEQYSVACRDFANAVPQENIAASQDVLTCFISQLRVTESSSPDRARVVSLVQKAARHLMEIAPDDLEAKRTNNLALAEIIKGIPVDDPAYDKLYEDLLSSFRELMDSAPEGKRENARLDYIIALQNYADTLVGRDQPNLLRQIDIIKHALGPGQPSSDRIWNSVRYGASRLDTLAKCPSTRTAGCLASMLELMDVARQYLDFDPENRVAVDDYASAVRMAARVYVSNLAEESSDFAGLKGEARARIRSHFEGLTRFKHLGDDEQKLLSALSQD